MIGPDIGRVRWNLHKLNLSYRQPVSSLPCVFRLEQVTRSHEDIYTSQGTYILCIALALQVGVKPRASGRNVSSLLKIQQRYPDVDGDLFMDS